MINKWKMVGKVLVSTIILGTIITGRNIVQAKSVSTNNATINNVSSFYTNEIFTTENSTQTIKEISSDLNSDNILENISLYYDEETGSCTVKVNDSSKSISLESNLGQDDLMINVIDLNKNDNIKEIQLIETIENDYKHIVFFKFDGTNLIKIIELKSDKLITGLSFDGKGNIKTSFVNQSLYTLGCIDNYKYDGKSIKYIPSKYYKLNTPTTIIFPIKVQKSQTNKAAPFKLYKGEKVTIVTTDGKGWFKLLNSKKKEGWFYFDKNTYKLQGKQQWQIFKNLPIAG